MKQVIEIDEKTVTIDGVEFVKVEPEFKTGQWVIVRNSGCLCSTHYEGKKYKGWKFGGAPNFNEPMRVVVIKDIEDQPNALIVEQREQTFIFSKKHNSRLATKEEIETHLIKVAKEKGYREGVKIICVTFPDRGQFELSGTMEYDIDTDKLIDWRSEKDNSYPAIYSDGKWAEILPSKKSLPKTKEECERFIRDYISFPGLVYDFMNEYE